MKRQFTILFPALFILAAPALSARAATHHVPSSFARITDAIAAATPGDTVRVAAGTYSGSANGEAFPLSLSAAIHLLGAGPGLSVLDAGATASVIAVTGGPGGHVSGFTLTGGRAVDGAGVLIAAGTPEVDHCLILANSAFRHGSGIHVTGGAAPWIHHNVIWDSEDWDHNDANDPHGIDLRGGNGLVEHNLVGRGVSNGIFIQPGGAPTVRNNILYENGTPGVRGRGICAFGDAGTVVAHNLFFGNAIAPLVVPASPFVDVTAAQANDLDPNDGIYGNVDGDPLFTDPDGFDWSLMPGSPAIDAGDPLSAPDPDGTTADIGPFFFDQSTSGAPQPPAGRILAAYPNPFFSSVDIEWRQSGSARTSVLILDVRGRIVHRVPGEDRGAGSHRVRWEGRDAAGEPAPSGLYYAVLRGAGPDRVVRLLRLR